MLINSRASSLVLLALIVSCPGDAAVPTNFALRSDSSSIVWSATSLNKGDVVEVHAFKAEPGTIVYLGMCNDQCDSAHIVKSIAVYRPGTNNATEKYTLEESGHLMLWTVQPPRLELHAGASISDSQNQVSDTIHSGFSGLYNSAEVLRIRNSEIDADRIKIRFDGGRYITLSRISAISP